MRAAIPSAIAIALFCAAMAQPSLLRWGLSESIAPGQSRETLGEVDLSAIDLSADACSNFYQRACGGFIARTVVSPEHPEISMADQEFEANLEANLDNLFTVQATPGSELGRLETFYQSCTADDPSNGALIKQWLGRIDAARTHRDIQSLIRSLSAIGVDPFFTYSGQPDPQNLSRFRGEIDSSNLWQEADVVERTFVLSGLPPIQAKAAAFSVAEIVTELRKHRNVSDNLADSENPRTLAQLKKVAPAIDWQPYLKLVGAPPGEPINLTSAAYLPAVSRTLAHRPIADLRAYLRWTFLFSLRGELPQPYNQAFGDIPPSVRVDLHDRAKACRDATIRAMGVEFSRQYSERILGRPTREAAKRMSESIRDQIVASVSQARWLSPSGRRQIAEKLQRTDLKIGFPDHWPVVGRFPLSRGAFIRNVLNSRRFEARRNWRRTYQIRSRMDWDMIVNPWVGSGMAAARLVQSNGFPDFSSNSLIMTAAFLTAPTFVPNAAIELNYGTYGATFAHEFVHVAEAHAFDADGRQREIWSASDLSRWNKQRQCVIDQDNAYPGPAGVKPLGDRRYDENIADLGGLRLAYEALAAKLGPRLNQPDQSGLTPAQRFFYKYAQTWCTAATIDDLRKRAEDDRHELPEYRANGPLSNLPEFAQAFGCKAGSPMRRSEDKVCRVW